MKKIARIVLSCLVLATILPAAVAHKRLTPTAVSVAGIYENFTVGQGSGDLEGMRVVIVSAGGGYYAIVQIAQGGAEDPKPEFVEAKVTGMNVEFTLNSVKYTGKVTAAGLNLKNSDGATESLKRRACATYFR